jgi:hypothetical protein
MSEQKLVDEKWVGHKVKQRPRGRSLFAPIALIAAGTFFLLANVNLVPQPNWGYALSFWPLLLIFLGLDILVSQAPAPGGTFLSLLVSLAAVGVFGYLLFAGADNATTRALGVNSAAVDLQEIPFSVPAGSAESAEIEIDLSNYATTITPLTGGPAIVDGTIWTRSGLALDSETEGAQAIVRVGEESGGWSFNPATWFAPQSDAGWQIRISDRLPVALRLNAGNGSVSADLAALNLTSLRLDGGNGRISAALPDGAYDGRIDGSNGSLQVTLPGDGRQDFTIDGGNGSMTLLLPEGVAARIDYDKGNGSITVDERFERIEGDGDKGAYETAGYSATGDGIHIQVDTGNGSLRIAQP